MLPSLPRGDRKLIQIVDAALADSARRSGEWLVCKPGCTQCCVGVFAISQLDALRLRKGFEQLKKTDPARAARIERRAEQSRRSLSGEFPGDTGTGVLSETEEAQERFEEFGNDDVCPVLDPETGRCDLYESRPLTCRAFGPPVRTEEGLGVCELCFHGATPEQIAECEMEVDPDGLEQKLLLELENKSGATGRTIVAYGLLTPRASL